MNLRYLAYHAKGPVRGFFLAVLMSCALLQTDAMAGIPAVSQVEVTDVTPASFSVTGSTTEPSSISLALFQANCSTPVSNPALVTAVSDTTGVFKATVNGLAKDTAYCWRITATSSSTSESFSYPQTPSPIRTAKAAGRTILSADMITPFGNDILKAPAPYVKDQSESAEGIMAVLLFPDGESIAPLSLIYANDDLRNYFDMNNLYGAATGSSLNLIGGERVRISERHGRSGCTIDRFRRVPADQETTKAADLVKSANPSDIDANDTVNILDILRVAKGMNTAQGDDCYNSELDVNNDGRVDAADLDSAIGGFDAKP